MNAPDSAGAGVLGGEDDVELAFIADADVVVVGGDGEAVDAVREFGVVEVEEVGLVAVDQVLGAEEPVLGEFGMGEGDVLVPLFVVVVEPLGGLGDGLDAVRHEDVAAGVEVLRIEAVPPLALAVRLGECVGVVVNAGERAFGVVVVGGLQPVPGVRAVVGDGETKAMLTGDLAVDADDVLLRADGDCVPGIVAGVVGVEVVVMVGEGGEVLCPGGDVEIHQLFGLPVLGLPEVGEFHEADLGGVSVGGEVVVVLLVALDVHLAGIPVSLAGNALRGPVVPYAELGVAEPVGGLVGVERIPCGLEGAGRDAWRGRGGCGLSEEAASGARGEGRGGRGGEGGLKKTAASEVSCGHAGDDRRGVSAWARRNEKGARVRSG